MIPGLERSVLVNCLHRESTDIIISGNILKNEISTSDASSKLVGKTLGLGRLTNSIIDKNIVQVGYILNDKIAWENLTITNNSASINVINSGSDTEMTNCYRAGNKSNGVFSDNYGAARPNPKTVPPGFSYFDTSLGKNIWTRFVSSPSPAYQWVDATGNVVTP